MLDSNSGSLPLAHMGFKGWSSFELYLLHSHCIPCSLLLGFLLGSGRTLVAFRGFLALSLGLFWPWIALEVIAYFSYPEYYNLDHVLLNIKYESYWLNMGYWKDTTDFATACTHLAKLLADSVDLNPNDLLLDVGFGCGDQLLFFSDHYSVGSIVGITSLEQHCKFARQRLISHPNVNIICGDAVNVPALVKDLEFSKVLALDCAYHFNTRLSFLKAAFDKLQPKGKLGLADIVMNTPSVSWLDSIILYLICKSTSSPLVNYVTFSEYESQLKDIGFTNVQIVDISHHVFSHLAGYIENRNAKYLNPHIWIKFKPVAWAMRWASKRLNFVIVTAQKS
jgi:cyclopropane fatty-acyl-phospholipid synthase-like methyltransferase